MLFRSHTHTTNYLLGPFDAMSRSRGLQINDTQVSGLKKREYIAPHILVLQLVHLHIWVIMTSACLPPSFIPCLMPRVLCDTRGRWHDVDPLHQGCEKGRSDLLVFPASHPQAMLSSMTLPVPQVRRWME